MIRINILLIFIYHFTVLVEGYGIQDVMGKPGVDGKSTKTNHIVEVKSKIKIKIEIEML